DKNIGRVGGDEVVVLYFAHPELKGAPMRSLAGFRRIHLAAGASEIVTFALHDRELSTVDEDGVRRIVPGELRVWIGGGQPVAGGGHRPSEGVETKLSITTGAVVPD